MSAPRDYDEAKSRKDKLKIKDKIDLAFNASPELKEFGKSFYQRLVARNSLRLDEKGQPFPKLYERPCDDRRYDAIARLFEKDSKSCCAVCFDGESILVAFNEDSLPAFTMDNPSEFTSALLAAQRPFMIFKWHMKSIAEMAISLKKRGIEPVSGFFYGGHGFSVEMFRHGFLSCVLKTEENSVESGIIYNILLRYGEFEKHSKADPSTIVDEFWEGFNATYDIEETLKQQAVALTQKDLDKFKRYLKDIVKVENFIASLPLRHPVLEGFATGKQVIEQVTNGPTGMHAEMRLYNRLYNHLSEARKKTAYMGISKLCCAHCNIAMTTAGIEQVYEPQNEIPGVRGFHGNGYAWPLDEYLLNDREFMGRFLGMDEAELEKFFHEDQIITHPKKGIIGRKKELALDIVQYICTLKIGDLKRHQFAAPFLVGARCLYPPESISISDADRFMEAYYLEERDEVFTERDIQDGRASRELILTAKKVKVLRQEDEDEEPKEVDKDKKTETPMQAYIRNTFDIYASNLSYDPSDGAASFVISPDLFVPRNELALLTNRATMFLHKKHYHRALFIYGKLVLRYEDGSSDCSPKYKAIAYYGLGTTCLKLKLPHAIHYLEIANELDPSNAQYSRQLVKFKQDAKEIGDKPTLAQELDEQQIKTETRDLIKQSRKYISGLYASSDQSKEATETRDQLDRYSRLIPSIRNIKLLRLWVMILELQLAAKATIKQTNKLGSAASQPTTPAKPSPLTPSSNLSAFSLSDSSKSTALSKAQKKKLQYRIKRREKQADKQPSQTQATPIEDAKGTEGQSTQLESPFDELFEAVDSVAATQSVSSTHHSSSSQAASSGTAHTASSVSASSSASQKSGVVSAIKNAGGSPLHTGQQKGSYSLVSPKHTSDTSISENHNAGGRGQGGRGRK